MKRWKTEEDYLLIIFVISVIVCAIIYYFKPSKTVFVDDYQKTEATSTKLLINEVSVYPVEAVELYNNTLQNINLDGYTIGDRMGRKYTIKNKFITSGAYLVFKTSELGFNINNASEIIELRNNEGKLIDKFFVGKLSGGISIGITNGKKVYYKNITLGSKNSDIIYNGYSDIVAFSKDGGYTKIGESISLSTKDGSKIYYTLDGSFPTLASNVYTSPITINQNTIIKAFSYKPGYLESDIVSRTFFVGREHNLPIVSVSTNNLEFYQKKKEEDKASFEIYEADGSFGVGFVGDIKTSGNGSLAYDQKSMSLYLRKKYSTNKITYPFFKDMSYSTYSSISLRNSGNDFSKIHIMETIMTEILKNQMDIDTRICRSVVVYLNGSYWGIYTLTEKLNSDYLESKHNLDKNKLDLIKVFWNVLTQQNEVVTLNGSGQSFNNLLSYLNSHDVSDSKVYEYLKTQIDMQELINSWIVEAFFANTDYPQNNVKYYKGENGKWRFIIYDFDWSYLDKRRDDFLVLNIDSDVSWVNIIKSLSQNEEFRELYFETLAKMLKTTFKPQRVNKIIDNLSSEIRKEMPYNIEKWANAKEKNDPSSMSEWEDNLKLFKEKYNNRYNNLINDIKNGTIPIDAKYQNYFGGLT